MVKALVAATILWPAVMGLAVWQRAEGATTVWVALPWVIGSQVCHQRPERSFHSDGVQWPVCGRCSGLYVAAPFGALAALWLARRRASGAAVSLAVAAVPTTLTLGAEWLGVSDVSNLARLLSALPLGALVGYWIVAVASGRPRSIG